MDETLKTLNETIGTSINWLRDEMRALRSNRPSVELLEELKLVYYNQPMTLKQLGSLSVSPPRSVVVQVWDKNAVGPVMKAIESAELGFALSNDGNTIYANLSPLTDERREELSRVVKKYAEAARIQIRSNRDEAIKALRSREESGDLTEDDVFSLKETIQKEVDTANGRVEELVEGKLKEIAG